MNTQEGLLQAVLDDPEDDFPRLVYADWLEENNFAKRAELIRVQIELAAMPTQPVCTCQDFVPHRPECPSNQWILKYFSRWKLAWDQESNMVRLRRVWNPEVGLPYEIWAGLENIRWSRGFIDQVSCGWGTWWKYGREAVLYHPLTEVIITDREPSQEFSAYPEDCYWAPIVWTSGVGWSNRSHSHYLPTEWIQYLKPQAMCCRYYSSAELAKADLQRAVLTWAKSSRD